MTIMDVTIYSLMINTEFSTYAIVREGRLLNGAEAKYLVLLTQR